MTPDRDSMRHPAAFRLYYTAVLVIAVALFAYHLPAAQAPPLAAFATVLALMIASEMRPVPLPGGGYATGTAMVDIASLVILGPLWTATADLAGTLLVQGALQRRPVVRVLHNAAIFPITAFAAGAAFTAVGGEPGRLAFPGDLGPLLVCGAAYFVCNSALVSTVVGLTAGPDPWRIWQSNFLRGILHHLSFVTLGSLAAVVYFSVGPWGLALFALPFLVARHSFARYLEIRSDLKDFVRALAGVLEEVDPYTRHHSIRVSRYAVRIARAMRRREGEVEEIEYAALVHDLGKIGPQHQHILHKPGALTHEEQRTLRAHPADGAEIVGKVRALRRAAAIVRSHHERPDGQGYPYGLRSEDVPLGARILNVADAFDAMTSDRPYRRALSVEAALRELDRGAGTQFDAEVVRTLLAMHARGEFPLLPSPSSEDLLQLKPRTTRQANA